MFKYTGGGTDPWIRSWKVNAGLTGLTTMGRGVNREVIRGQTTVSSLACMDDDGSAGQAQRDHRPLPAIWPPAHHETWKASRLHRFDRGLEAAAGRVAAGARRTGGVLMAVRKKASQTAWSVAEAKSHLDDVIGDVENVGPQTLVKNRDELAVVVPPDNWIVKHWRKGTLLEFFQSSGLG